MGGEQQQELPRVEEVLGTRGGHWVGWGRWRWVPVGSPGPWLRGAARRRARRVECIRCWEAHRSRCPAVGEPLGLRAGRGHG